MPEFQPERLAEITCGTWSAGPPAAITGFSFDTRRVEPGDCFIALKGERRDGHDFLGDAAEKGARCAITGRAVDCALPQLVVPDPLAAMAGIAGQIRAEFPNPIVGITGSCGKTSTKEMLRLLLGESATHATAGNWNNRIGVPMTLFGLDPSEHAFGVIEAGINQPGEMGLLGRMIRADLSILTNIGPAHLELLGSLEGIAAEKSMLARESRSAAPVILPAEALEYPAYAEMSRRCIAVRFDGATVAEDAGEVVPCRIEPEANGSGMRLGIEGWTYFVQTSSRGMACNAALAIVAARRLGVPEETLAERLRHWRPERTRGKVVEAGNRFYYIDCYNANPASMIDSLQAFQRSAPPALPRCYIIGAMNELGEMAESFHVSVGERLALRPEDTAVFVGPDALTAAYLRGAASNGVGSGQIRSVENTAGIESMVADFKGALFLKGSRSHQLEKLLPESLL